MPTANIPPGTDGRPDRLSRARVSSRSTSLAKEKFRCLADPFERLTACVFRAHVGMVLLGEPEVGRSHRRVVCTTREAKRSQRRLAHEHRSDPALSLRTSSAFQRTGPRKRRAGLAVFGLGERHIYQHAQRLEKAAFAGSHRRTRAVRAPKLTKLDLGRAQEEEHADP